MPFVHFEITDDSFQQAWEDAFAWLIEGGYECDEKPCFELYHNDGSEHPEGKWIFDICIPAYNGITTQWVIVPDDPSFSMIGKGVIRLSPAGTLGY